MSEMFRDRLSQWSLEQVEFLLSHVEKFVEDDVQTLREKVKNFVPQTGLENIQRLVEVPPGDARMPRLVLESLAPFFDAGLLLQRGPSDESSNWWVTDFIWRGQAFNLDLKDQVRALQLVPEITPLQIHHASAKKVLEQLNMQFLPLPNETEAYLLRPTPTLAYILFSNLAAPWALDHLASAHKLINNCYIW